MEDEYLDAMYESQHEHYDDYRNDDGYDDVLHAEEEPYDHLLEQQEMEDFEQADEYFGCYGDD